MIIIGCDFHPSYQQIALLDTETGQPTSTNGHTLRKKLSDFIGD
jgi:hypothetical protein